MMEMKIEPSINVHFVFIFHVSMESVDARFSEPSVEVTTPNAIEQGYYYLGLVDHLELMPLEVSTSSSLEIEMQLAVVNGAKALHDVGLLLLSPLMEVGILQGSAKTFSLANYRFQKLKTFFVLSMKLHIQSLFSKRFQGF
jgi:hypothetical protein